MRRRWLGAAVVLAGLLGVSQPIDSSSRLVVRVSPRVARAPATVRVRIEVELARANRGLDVVMESTGYYASTHVSINGEAGPRVNAVAFHGVPAGKYKVSATVSAGGDEQFGSEQSVEILSR